MRHIEINKEWNSRQPFTVLYGKTTQLNNGGTITTQMLVIDAERPVIYTAHNVIDSFYEGRYLVIKDKRTGSWGHFIIPRNEQE